MTNSPSISNSYSYVTDPSSLYTPSGKGGSIFAAVVGSLIALLIVGGSLTAA